MNRTAALLSALLITGVTAACGGRVVIDTGTGGSAAATGSTSSASGSTGGGGCDVASHTIDIADFDVSCTQASDCTPVFIGSFCSACWCPNASINVADLMKYGAEKQLKAAGAPPSKCFCPEDPMSCVQGQCVGASP